MVLAWPISPIAGIAASASDHSATKNLFWALSFLASNRASIMSGRRGREGSGADEREEAGIESSA